MLLGTTSHQSEEKLDLRKYCLIIISLTLISVQINAQNGWTKKRDLNPPRAWASACVFNDKIYVIGGFHPTSGDFDLNEVYDPLVDQWETKEHMPTKRAGLLTAVINDTIYAMGGSNTQFTDKNEAYNPINNSWTTKKSLPYTWNGVYGDTIGDTVYIMGGHYNRQNCWAYNPKENTWTEKSSIPPNGCKGTLSATAYNGLIYTFGGVTNYPNGPMSTVNAYNPKTDTWDTTKMHMPTPRYALRTFLVQDKIYALGGSQSNGNALSTMEVYDPINNTWETLPNMPFKITWFTGAVFNNKIYLFGGTPDWLTGGQEVWEYDPSFVVTVEPVPLAGITSYQLEQNFPNPFNPSTTISWQSPVGSWQTLKIYDVLGNEVATLVNEYRNAGSYDLEFNASKLSSGVYYYKLSATGGAGEFIQTKKMILLK